MALIGGGSNDSEIVVDNISVKPLSRGAIGDINDPYRFSIKRLISNRDETIDIDSVAWETALKISKDTFMMDPGRAKKEPEEPRGTDIRRIRGFGYPEADIEAIYHPLLLLYLFKLTGENREVISLPCSVAAFAVSFPYSRQTGVSVPYRVNPVWLQEYYDAE